MQQLTFPNPVTSTPAAGATASGAGSAVAGSDSFGEMMRRGIETLDATQKVAENEIARAVTGESPDLHQTVVALQMVDISFQFALQVRNKVVGAYEEIMRMQV